MLKKLTKYELAACMRSCVPVYAAVMLAAVLMRLFMVMPYGIAFLDITRELTQMLYTILIMSVFVLTLTITINRFSKHFLGDEGYLMFTLPVTNGQHIISKLIVATILNITAVLVTVLSLFIFVTDADFLYAMQDVLQSIAQVSMWPVYVVELIVLALISMLSFVLTIYMCISLGHLAHKHRKGVAIGAFFVLGLLMQLLAQTVGMIIDVTGVMDTLLRMPSSSVGHVLLLSAIAFSIVECLVGFFVTRIILNRKLNLE